MPECISAVKATAKWGISKRRVALLCSMERIPGASIVVGQKRIIPINAESLGMVGAKRGIKNNDTVFT